MPEPTPKEIREAFADYRAEWQDVYDEGDADMQAISTLGPWSDQDRTERENAGRPCVHLDQINQFINQTIGNARKNKRAVKAAPKSAGASKEDANKRSTLIMGIEERSQAQPIYLYAFECMIQRSYGFALLRTEYQDETSFDQTIVIKPVQNPSTVLITPYYQQADASDIEEGFIVNRIPKEKFKEKYPKAEIKDFTGEIMGDKGVSDWVSDKMVQEGEYWKIENDYKTLLLIETEAGRSILTEEEWLRQGKPGRVARDRRVATPRVMQYMTNGLEILEKHKWDGSRVPIISCFGPERWTNDGGKAKRELLSMVRFARDPQMLFDYLASGECEVAGKIPKVPFVGAKGQFESDKETWEELDKVPHNFVQYDIVNDGGPNGGAGAPPPVYQQFTPDFQEWEIAKDAAARHIQSAMGISALPSAAQRRNEKSGVALERIDDMESLGSFHFVDRYENHFLHNVGYQVNELITPILDTERHMQVTAADGSRSLMHVVGKTSHPIDDKGAYDVQGLAEDHLHTGKGEFDVTISSGPSHDSERDAQSAFVDSLLENMPNLPQPGTPSAKVLALAIRMRPDLGPIGEQIADVFDPPDPSNLPPAAQAAISQLQAKMQELLQENSALHMDRAGRVLEQQTKKEIEAMKQQGSLMLQHLKDLTDLIKAELGAKSRSTDAKAQADASRLETVLGFAHDAASQTMDHTHDHALADKQAANAKDLAAHTAALQPNPAPDATQPGSAADGQ